MHHPDAELIENAQVTEFVRHGNPLLRERDPVTGEVQAMPPLPLRFEDVLRDGRLGNDVAKNVGRIGEAGQSLEQPQGILAFLARVLKDAGDSGSPPGVR